MVDQVAQDEPGETIPRNTTLSCLDNFVNHACILVKVGLPRPLSVTDWELLNGVSDLLLHFLRNMEATQWLNPTHTWLSSKHS